MSHENCSRSRVAAQYDAVGYDRSMPRCQHPSERGRDETRRPRCDHAQLDSSAWEVERRSIAPSSVYLRSGLLEGVRGTYCSELGVPSERHQSILIGLYCTL